MWLLEEESGSDVSCAEGCTHPGERLLGSVEPFGLWRTNLAAGEHLSVSHWRCGCHGSVD